jgi:SulP family sulfate permease
VAGGFSRTAVNVEAGARSGLASLVTAITVAVTLLLLTPLFHHLPRAVLAAIILTAVSSLVNVAEARHLARVSRSDLGLLLLTFAATLALGIEQGILVGVLGSLSWFVWRSSAPAVVLLGQLPGTTTWRSLARNPEARPMPGVLALRIDGPLFFASTAAVQSAVMSAVTTQTAHLILSLGGVGTVDAQGLEVLDELHERLAEQEVTLWLAGARAPIRDALDAAGIPERIACFGSVQEALVAATGGLCVAAR